jgi:hypothetical protein
MQKYYRSISITLISLCLTRCNTQDQSSAKTIVQRSSTKIQLSSNASSNVQQVPAGDRACWIDGQVLYGNDGTTTTTIRDPNANVYCPILSFYNPQGQVLPDENNYLKYNGQKTGKCLFDPKNQIVYLSDDLNNPWYSPLRSEVQYRKLCSELYYSSPSTTKLNFIGTIQKGSYQLSESMELADSNSEINLGLGNLRILGNSTPVPSSSDKNCWLNGNYYESLDSTNPICPVLVFKSPVNLPDEYNYFKFDEQKSKSACVFETKNKIVYLTKNTKRPIRSYSQYNEICDPELVKILGPVDSNNGLGFWQNHIPPSDQSCWVNNDSFVYANTHKDQLNITDKATNYICPGLKFNEVVTLPDNYNYFRFDEKESRIACVFDPSQNNAYISTDLNNVRYRLIRSSTQYLTSCPPDFVSLIGEPILTSSNFKLDKSSSLKCRNNKSTTDYAMSFCKSLLGSMSSPDINSCVNQCYNPEFF